MKGTFFNRLLPHKNKASDSDLDARNQAHSY